ncbi:Pre-rRNA-processing protein IPI3 [Leucoagaricus sp. SymC.cos]|nr:Pre-rRNA-processing protein IPI3 [Leucoagaricus sp. SymC.cos]
MRLQELILCATAPTSSESGAGSVALHDIQSTISLASFKQTSAGRHCTAIFESTSTQGGFILAAQPDKTILNVYNFQKDQIALRVVLPEKITCLAVDKSGDYCAGGTLQGRIYLWEISSGILFQSWDAHYRRVSVLKFTNDGTAIISGSEDSSVNIWLLSRLLDNEGQNDLPVPHCTLSDHTLPITDIQCGVGASLTCRILTASVDHSVKLWDLSSGTLLTTFQFPRVITHLAWDVTERVFFAATPDGSIHRVNLFRKSTNAAGDLIDEAVGGGGTSNIIRIGEENDKPQTRNSMQVGEAVSAMAISLTSTLLLVGTTNGMINLYDLPSHQLLRTISTHKGFSISHLTTLLKPPDLIGHISLDLKVGSMSDAKDALPAKPVQPFQRMKDAKAREAHEIHTLLHAKRNPYQDETTEYSPEEFFRDHASFVQPSDIGGASLSGVDSAASKNRIIELEAEIARLREQLGKAKSVNDAMWDTVVQRLVNNENEGGQTMTTEKEEESDPRRRKRSRGA